MINFLSELEKSALDWYGKLSRRIDCISDGVLILSLSVFYFLWRILFLPMFEFSGDAAWKWRFLRYYHETGNWFPLPPEHHQGRWAQNIPVSLLMDWFGSTSLWIGAIFPVLCGFAVLLLVWFITRRLGSKIAAIAACLSTMLYFVFFQESAQLLPSLPCAMFTLLALYLMILYLNRPERLYFPLLAGVAMGMAWGCKVTACYWCAGIGLFLILFPESGKNVLSVKKIRIGWDVLFFCMGFLLIFIPEFFLINDFFHVTQGRFSMLRGHLGDNPILHEYNFFQYVFSPVLIFLNFSGKMIYKVPFCLLFLLVLPPLFLQLRAKNISPAQKFLAFTLLVAALIHCYMVVKIFPFKHPERPLPRYFLTLSLTAFILFYTASRRLPEGKANFRILLRFAYAALFLVMIIFMMIGWINDPLINGDHLFNKIQAYQCIQMQKNGNLPMLVQYEKRDRYTTRTHKIALLWKTHLAPLQELAGILKETPAELQKQWSKHEAVTDSCGKRYAHVAGPRPAAGSTADCIVIREAHVRREMLSIADQKEKREK